MVRHLLRAHDLDMRFQLMDVRHEVAVLYVPLLSSVCLRSSVLQRLILLLFLLKIVDHVEKLEFFDEDQSRELLLCVTFILRNLQRDFVSLSSSIGPLCMCFFLRSCVRLFSEWISRRSYLGICRFVRLLSHVLHAFSDPVVTPSRSEVCLSSFVLFLLNSRVARMCL